MKRHFSLTSYNLFNRVIAVLTMNCATRLYGAILVIRSRLLKTSTTARILKTTSVTQRNHSLGRLLKK